MSAGCKFFNKDVPSAKWSKELKADLGWQLLCPQVVYILLPKKSIPKVHTAQALLAKFNGCIAPKLKQRSPSIPESHFLRI
jgi:hypothetical protein